MDVCNALLVQNHDWDPSYLSMLFSNDFWDYTKMWNSNVTDMELVHEVDKVEAFSPIVEVLCSVVEKTEDE